MTLSDEEREFCQSVGLVAGYDDDDPDKHQFVHLCWPYQSGGGTLCESPRLWFRAGAPEIIDCEQCLKRLPMLRGYPLELLKICGRLARRVELLVEVERCSRDLQELTYHPEKYVGKDWAALPAAWERLNAALTAEHEDLVQGAG